MGNVIKKAVLGMEVAAKHGGWSGQAEAYDTGRASKGDGDSRSWR